MTRNQRDLSETDEQELTSWAQRGGRHGERARVVLMSAHGLAAGDVARELGLTVPTVYKWRKRFRLEGAKGLRDRARPGQPRRLSPARRDEIQSLTCDDIPTVANRWTIRSVAKVCNVTQHQVRAVWREQELARHVVSANLLSSFTDAPRHHALCALFLAPPLSVAVLAPEAQGLMRPLLALGQSDLASGAVRSAWRRSRSKASQQGITAQVAELFSFMASVRDNHPVEPLWLVFSSKMAFAVPHVIPTISSRTGISVGAWRRADAWVDSVEACLSRMLQEVETSPAARLSTDLVARLHAHGEGRAFAWVRSRAGTWDRAVSASLLSSGVRNSGEIGNSQRAV